MGFEGLLLKNFPRECFGSIPSGGEGLVGETYTGRPSQPMVVYVLTGRHKGLIRKRNHQLQMETRISPSSNLSIVPGLPQRHLGIAEEVCFHWSQLHFE